MTTLLIILGVAGYLAAGAFCFALADDAGQDEGALAAFFFWPIWMCAQAGFWVYRYFRK